jgi:RNA polymerase sigma-70 factor (ECF subfamily)
VSSSDAVATRVALPDADAELVAAALIDRAAFAPLYQHYVDPVYRYCLRRLGNKESAEDATSQIFAKVLAGLPGYRADRSSFRSWLFAISHHVLVDLERARRPQQGLDSADLIADPDPGPEHAALCAESRREVQLLLASVPPDQRRILELRLAGLTTVEIGQALGHTPNAVRVSQFRAMTRLRLVMGLAPHRTGGQDA